MSESLPRLRHYFVAGSPCPRCLEPLEERDGGVACTRCDYRAPGPAVGEGPSAAPERGPEGSDDRQETKPDGEEAAAAPPGAAANRPDGPRPAGTPPGHESPSSPPAAPGSETAAGSANPGLPALPSRPDTGVSLPAIVDELMALATRQEGAIAALAARPLADSELPSGLMSVFASLMQQVEDQHLRVTELTRAIQSPPVSPQDFYRALRDGLDGMRGQLQAGLEAQADRLESRLRSLEESIRQRESEVLERERRLDEREARLAAREQRAEAEPALLEELARLRQRVEAQDSELALLRPPVTPPARRHWWPFYSGRRY